MAHRQVKYSIWPDRRRCVFSDNLIKLALEPKLSGTLRPDSNDSPLGANLKVYANMERLASTSPFAPLLQGGFAVQLWPFVQSSSAEA
jgi:hypothetical protein